MKFSWHRIRRIWATLGATALVGYFIWMLIAFRASDVARQALVSDAAVVVVHVNGHWWFTSTAAPRPADIGLLFFPGGLVDPVAYAPLARAVATGGYPVLLVALPLRGAFGGADRPELFERARSLMSDSSTATKWVVAGHSRGALVAARLAAANISEVAGLVLIGSSHPREFSLATTRLPVTKIYATRDGIAGPDTIAATRSNLPTHTRWVAIDGGNHSQFGWYGFQIWDRRATISREAQQRLTVQALLEALKHVQ